MKSRNKIRSCQKETGRQDPAWRRVNQEDWLPTEWRDWWMCVETQKTEEARRSKLRYPRESKKTIERGSMPKPKWRVGVFIFLG